MQKIRHFYSENKHLPRKVRLIKELPGEQSFELLQELDHSTSKDGQDLFALSNLSMRRKGYFVEFGAADGVTGSNSYLLEKRFGWSGLLAEPAKCWHSSLRENRSASIETRCIWSESNKLMEFNEAGENSSLSQFFTAIGIEGKKARQHGYKVDTLSLNDALERHNSPAKIDALFIDTEGSEFEILRTFDFRKYQVSVITCEHNFTASRQAVFDLLNEQGFDRRHQNLSRNEDWFVNRNVVTKK